jgi:CubicO group peptidase (beta-lactamase class C family)
LLGAIIERVSGQDYYDYVRVHIYKPAHMRDTGSDPEDQPVPQRSLGYMRPPSATDWASNNETLPYRGTAAGGGYSTVRDLHRFVVALTGGTLLNRTSLDLLTTGKVEGGPGRYAYGFGDVSVGGVRWFGHSGGAPGMNGDLRVYPQAGYIIAVLANQDPPGADRISEFIGNRLPAQ